MLLGDKLTILDLNSELKRKLKEATTPEQRKEIERLKKSREKTIAKNKKQGYKRREYTRKEIKKLKQDEFTPQGLEERKEEIKNSGYQKYPHSPFVKVIDNELNRVIGKNFHYTISDDFNFSAYQIKVSTLLKKDNPGLYVLERLEKKIKIYLEGAKVLPQDLAMKRNIIGMEKMLEVISHNKRQILRGTTDYEGVYNLLDLNDRQSLPEGQWTGDYPIMINISGSTIQIGV